MKKILCFGNPFIKEDNLAIRLANELMVEGFEFIPCDSPQEVTLHPDAFAIMDVTYGIDEIRVLEDYSRLVPKSMASLHDFDLSFFLKLMHETGRISTIKIIALPANMGLQEAKKQVIDLLKI